LDQSDQPPAPTLNGLMLRTVHVQKKAGERTHIGLTQSSRTTVSVSSMCEDSPVAGLLQPGDVITAIGGVPMKAAREVAQKLVESTSLELQVLTPYDAESVFIQPSLLELDLGKDKKTGLPRVNGARTMAAPSPSRRDLECGGDMLLRPGDLLLAVGAVDGSIHTVDSPKAVHQLLRESLSVGEGAFVEVRVVRDTPISAREEPQRGHILAELPPEVTRCVARDAVRRETPPPTGTGDSGRSSPTSSSSDLGPYDDSSEAFTRRRPRLADFAGRGDGSPKSASHMLAHDMLRVGL